MQLNEGRKENGNLAIAYAGCYIVSEFGQLLTRGFTIDFDTKKLQTESYIPRPAPVLTEALLKALPLKIDLIEGWKHWMWKEVVKGGAEGLHLDDFYSINYRMHRKNLSGIGPKILGMENLPEKIYLPGFWPTHSVYKPVGYQ